MEPSDTNHSIQPITKPAHHFRKSSPILCCPHCGIPFQVPPSQKNGRDSDNNSRRRTAPQKFEFDPEQLRQLVWEMPISQIARLYGVTGKVVEKTCRALGFSIPSCGYWTSPDLEEVSQEELE